MKKVIAIDPGHKKCGLLLADLECSLAIDGKISINSSVVNLINYWIEKHSVELILLGNGTSSKYWQSELLAENISPIKLVDERMTTLRARERYLEIFPPEFLIKLIPKGLILPPKNLDVIVSLILIEDYFQVKLRWSKSIELKIWP